jgi:hypothetical protein
MGHQLIVEVTVKYQDGWYYPLYRALGSVPWKMVSLGGSDVACFKDPARAEGLLEAVCDEFIRDGFYCQFVEMAG